MKARFFDTLRLISVLSPRRIVNLLRLVFSYYVSRYTGKVWHSGNPYTVSIEPTTSCNLRCPECPSGLRKFSRNTGKISLELYQEVIDQMHPDLFYLIL